MNPMLWDWRYVTPSLGNRIDSVRNDYPFDRVRVWQEVAWAEGGELSYLPRPR